MAKEVLRMMKLVKDGDIFKLEEHVLIVKSDGSVHKKMDVIEKGQSRKRSSGFKQIGKLLKGVTVEQFKETCIKSGYKEI